ncbi:predicted protein [Thalassiosira pseudonana CCMP1335]|jgi:hypothetical protein|uniref:Uncharacterized protein n=1 Tax=Thalassiosira pseudonana TaxID=35128 RepID=B8BSW3_THAPS|nr:predicted protein [Thalassiosira pseudonana CCMP1335]EED95615.1 predicted protein [Thalassiosira pseudonana CCMP1335]|mmetsp:Transcript_12/g.32  ORF Transcript_12/g.32 Transcript_12/m.32 type:complete len:145 (+) Transcript_12:137-571(+)|eukprot:scaffold13659_cov193-Alexandrium_tamarense.AAC.3
MISQVSKLAPVVARNVVAQRQLSMATTQSVDKLNNILEEYRAMNYTQELPKRFRTDIVNAAASSNCLIYSATAAPSTSSSSSTTVSADGIEKLLQNIGAGHRMSRSEIESILREVGGSNRAGEPENCFISKEQMLDLISMRKAA